MAKLFKAFGIHLKAQPVKGMTDLALAGEWPNGKNPCRLVIRYSGEYRVAYSSLLASYRFLE